MLSLRDVPLAVLAPAVGALALSGCGSATPTPQESTTLEVIALATAKGVGEAGPVAAPGPRATWTLPPGARPPSGVLPTPGVLEPTSAPARVVPESGPALVDPDIVAMASRITADRLAADVRTLAGFGTRHSLSVADADDRGIGAARTWLHGAFDRLNVAGSNQVQVTLEDFALSFGGRTTPQANVLATLPGVGQPKRFVYITAHYDSRADDPTDGGSAAPGASDNASGTAALIELARVLAERRWDAGIRLAAFAAGEADHRGSAEHARGAREFGLPIIAVLDNEAIAASGAGSEAVVFASGADGHASRRLGRYVALMAQRYGLTQVLLSAGDSASRGDYTSFHDAGFAAVGLRATGAELLAHHTAGDTPDHLDPARHVLVTRLNLVVAANLAQAPPPPQSPVVRREGDVLNVSWPVVDHPRVAGYWVAVRSGESDDYDLAWAGARTELVLPYAPDMAVAVATSDDRGHMSLFGPESTP